MSLTVHLTKTADHREIGLTTPTHVFESDGICCYFEPTFQKIGEATGKFVDPWDGGAFQTRAELEALLSAFAAAQAEIASLPEELRVKTGTVMSEPPEEMFEDVRREDLSKLVAGIVDFVRKALAKGHCVYFYGD